MLFIVSQAPLLMKISSKDDRLLLFSLNAGFQTLAGAVGNLFAGQLPGFFGGLLHVQADSASAYQAVLLFTVAAGTLSLIPMFMVQEPRAREEKNQEKPRAKFGWEVIRITLRLSTPNVLIGFGAAILIPYANVFFRETFNTSDNTLGLMFSLAALITGAASIVAPRLAAWLGGKIRAVVTTQAISLVFLELMGFAPWQAVAVASFLVRGALMNMSAPLYSAFVMEQVDERHQGTVNSITALAWNMGWAVGPFISGVVQERHGFAPLFIATGALYFTAVLMTWMLFGRTEQANA
jgi:MFS family permease